MEFDSTTLYAVRDALRDRNFDEIAYQLEGRIRCWAHEVQVDRGFPLDYLDDLISVATSEVEKHLPRLLDGDGCPERLQDVREKWERLSDALESLCTERMHDWVSVEGGASSEGDDAPGDARKDAPTVFDHGKEWSDEAVRTAMAERDLDEITLRLIGRLKRWAENVQIKRNMSYNPDYLESMVCAALCIVARDLPRLLDRKNNPIKSPKHLSSSLEKRCKDEMHRFLNEGVGAVKVPHDTAKKKDRGFLDTDLTHDKRESLPDDNQIPSRSPMAYWTAVENLIQATYKNARRHDFSYLIVLWLNGWLWGRSSWKTCQAIAEQMSRDSRDRFLFGPRRVKQWVERWGEGWKYMVRTDFDDFDLARLADPYDTSVIWRPDRHEPDDEEQQSLLLTAVAERRRLLRAG